MPKPENPQVFKPKTPQAFPVPLLSIDEHGICYIEGMTLLDYFAGQEMQRHALSFNTALQWDLRQASKHNYDYAEAMLAERERRMS